MEYTVDYFINFFNSIPEDKWCINLFDDHSGRHCANGLLGVTNIHLPNPASSALQKIAAPLEIHWGQPKRRGETVTDIGEGYSTKIATINNGNTEEYQQWGPKVRVLAALRDIKRMQQHKEADKIIEEITNKEVWTEKEECTHKTT